jgi:hypothetical protein
MANRPASFRQADVTRAIKAARKAGIEIARVEVDNGGKITIIVGKPSETSNETEPNDWAEIHNGRDQILAR